MLIDQQSIMVCFGSMFWGSLMAFAAWMNLPDASGGFAKTLAVLLFGGLVLFFIGLFSLVFGEAWMDWGKYDSNYI
jgi:hypothetical protein